MVTITTSYYVHKNHTRSYWRLHRLSNNLSILGSSRRNYVCSLIFYIVAQGEYEQAAEAYRQALDKEPDNRLGWTDMAKLYVEKLEQPELAVEAIREGGPLL